VRRLAGPSAEGWSYVPCPQHSYAEHKEDGVLEPREWYFIWLGDTHDWPSDRFIGGIAICIQRLVVWSYIRLPEQVPDLVEGCSVIHHLVAVGDRVGCWRYRCCICYEEVGRWETKPTRALRSVTPPLFTAHFCQCHRLGIHLSLTLWFALPAAFRQSRTITCRSSFRIPRFDLK
jgi:hypothetical protein